jgi:uncharacterized repeat protein (TIGR01451 family)
MSRLSAAFVLNYLTRIVPSLGHVGKKMKPDRVVKGAAILAAIGGVFGGDVAFAATFNFRDPNFGGGARTAPAANAAATNYRTADGVTVRMTVSTNGGLAVTATSIGNLGYANGLPANTLTYNIDQTDRAPLPVGPFGTLGLRAQFLNAADQVVPIQNLRFRVIDVDKDALGNGDVALRDWQDQVAVFSQFGGVNVPLTPTILDPNGTVIALPVASPQTLTVPAGLGFGFSAVPAGALSFIGRDDDDLVNAVFSADLSVTPATGLDNNDTLPDAPTREAYNRSQEGSVEFTTSAVADEFVILYGDGPTYVNGPAAHGLGILGDFQYAPGIIGVRKRVTSVVNNGGTVTATYEVAVTNLGETALNNVALDDNLGPDVISYNQSFGNIPAGFTISTAPAASAGSTLTLNPGYNGGTDDQLLGANNTLAINETKTLTYSVTFAPGAVTQFDSQVVASGTMPGGGITRDRSNDGAAFDSDGDKDPTAAGAVRSDLLTGAANFTASTGILSAAGAGDDTVTSFILPTPTPQIGVTKQVVGQPVAGSDATGSFYDVTYRQIVRNVSASGTTPDDLTNVRLSEDLNATFRVGTPTGAASATVQSVTPQAAPPAGFPNVAGQTFVAIAAPNPAFNGTTEQNLIAPAGNSLLNRGDYSVVDFVVRLRPQAGIPLEGLAVFEGQVTAIANPAGSPDPTATVRDLSDDVTGVAPILDDAGTGASQITRADGSANTPLATGGLPATNPIPANDPQAATNENNRTPVSFAAQPAIALSKRVTNVVDNGNGTFDVTYRQLVQNIGPTTLTGVQISENLNTTFRVGATDGARAIQVLSTTPVASAAALNAGGATVPAAGFVPLTAGAFTGVTTGQDMLFGNNVLAPNQYGAVDFVVRVTPGNTPESYGIPAFNGTATANGTQQGTETVVTDPSEDAARFPKGTVGAPAAEVLDANNDGIANQGATTPGAVGENTPTPVLFPQIAVAKRISSVTGTGTDADPYIVEYTVVTTNVGATTLTNVQTTETSLDVNFPAAQVTDPNANYVPDSLVVVPGVVTTPLNPGFTAEDGNQNLFGSGLTLEPSQSTTVRYRVRLVSPPNNITFNSQSTAVGEGDPAPTVPNSAAEGGFPLLRPSDLSDDGAVVDPNDADGLNGRGVGEDDPTPIIFPIGPQIGLTKQVFGTPIANPDGTYDVTFRYRVQNTGLVPLTGVSIADNLQAQFAGQGLNRTTNPPPVEQFVGVIRTTPQPTEGTGPVVVVGGSANRGLSDTPADALGTVPGTLGIGDSSVVDVVVRVRPGAANLTNRYDGAARAVGTGGSTPTAVNDISDDGTFLNSVAQTPTPDTLKPPVGNPNDPNAQNATPVIFAQGAPPIALFKAITAVPGQTFTAPLGIPGAPPSVVGVSNLNRNLTNGDQVIYTLYVVNTTTAPIVNFEVCDALQSGQLFVSANNLPTGVTSRAFGPLTPPGPAPLGRTCNPATGGAGGTVVFTIPSLPTGTTALPFTIRVNR